MGYRFVAAILHNCLINGLPVRVSQLGPAALSSGFACYLVDCDMRSKSSQGKSGNSLSAQPDKSVLSSSNRRLWLDWQLPVTCDNFYIAVIRQAGCSFDGLRVYVHFFHRREVTGTNWRSNQIIYRELFQVWLEVTVSCFNVCENDFLDSQTEYLPDSRDNFRGRGEVTIPHKHSLFPFHL